MEDPLSIPSANFPRPSRWSFYWWRVFFGPNPYSIFNEYGLCYDPNGFLYSRGRRKRQTYWIDESPFHVRSKSLLVAYAICCLLFPILFLLWTFSWPWLIAIPWLLATCLTIAAVLIENGACWTFQIYNFSNILLFCLYNIYVVLQILEQQDYYGCYFPGTPGVQVKPERLLILFKRQGYVFLFLFTPLSVIVAILGLYTSLMTFDSAKVLDTCPSTSFALFWWVTVNLMNCIAFVGMRYAVSSKHQKLQSDLYNWSSDPAPIAEVVETAQPVILEPNTGAGLPPYSIYVGEDETPPDYRLVN